MCLNRTECARGLSSRRPFSVQCWADRDLSGFAADTTLYPCGARPGRLAVVRAPRRGEVRARVLDSLALEGEERPIQVV
jgi:hypothetical protein